MRLTNATLRDSRSVDIDVADGKIASITTAGSAAVLSSDKADADVGSTHDLGGWLLLSAMAEPHAHLDKALTAEAVPNPTGDLMGAIEAWRGANARGELSHENTVVRAKAAFAKLLISGVTAVRTHVNVLAETGMTPLLAVKEAATAFEGLMDVQIVALTGFPMTGAEGKANRVALDQAIEVGVDLVGGCPHLDPDGPALIRHALAVATDAGLGIDLHVDETLDASVLTLRDYATLVLDHGFDGLKGAGHCVTLGMQAPAVQAEVAGLVADAGISVFPLPQTNLFLQAREYPTATPRGLTAVAALGDAGALVAAGADNVQDPFNLVGRSDPLETAALMVMAGHQLPDTAFEMVSTNARRALGLEPVTFDVGSPADFVAIDAPSVRAAVADAPYARKVFHRGRLVASSTAEAQIHTTF